MGSAPLLLLAPRVTDDSVAVWRAALANGWTSQRLSNWRVPDALKNYDGEIVIYAEPLFAEAVADQLGFALIEPPPSWLPSLPQRFLHRSVELGLLSQVDFTGGPKFVKPAEGKVFEPRVYSDTAGLPPVGQIGDVEVMVSDPVSFTLEVRCFVIDAKVVAASPYWRSDELAIDADGRWPFLDSEEEQALAFADRVLTHPDVSLPPAFVLDVGITREHGWAVIEGNPCWGAGLYGCDPVAALETGRRALKRRSDLTPEDRPWISARQKTID